MVYGPEAKLVFSFLTILAITGFGLYLLSYITPPLKIWRTFVNKHKMKFATAAAVLATAGSLFFSEIAGYEPCKFCWLQRIFMYPLAIMLPLALWKKDTNVKRYAFPLALIGLPIAGYHYGLQVYAKLNPAFVDSCSATGVSCAMGSFTWGFISIPLMAFVAFLMIIFCLTRK